MKKLTALLLALVMALSFSSAVLADEADNTTPVTTEGVGSTIADIALSSDAQQISVTVPLKITGVIGANGTITFADSGTYKIVNNGLIPVKVAKVKMTNLDSKLNLSGDQDVLSVSVNGTDLTEADQDVAWGIGVKASAPVTVTGTLSSIKSDFTDVKNAFSIQYTVTKDN